MPITIKEIAELCGVSVSSVSRAMNNHKDIKPQTRKKIMQVIEEHGYIPNDSARNLKRIESDSILIMAKDIDNPLFSNMISVYQQQISKQGYQVYISHVDRHSSAVTVAQAIVKEKKPKGIIFLGGYFNEAQQDFANIKLPFVLSTVDANYTFDQDVLGCFVSVDDCKESFALVDHLCKQGHEQIAVLCSNPKDKGIGALRLEGYKKALLQNGLPYDERLVVYMKDHYPAFSMQSGYEMTIDLLNRDTGATAIFAISDLMAIGACKAIHQRGKRIPEDYAVAGFDGLPHTFYYEPSITTMQQPVELIAHKTVDALFEMIQTHKKVDNTILPAALLTRQSTKITR